MATCDGRDPNSSLPSDRLVRNEYICMGPVQPRLPDYPAQNFGKQNRKFNSAWLEKFHWLEYSISADRAFCFPCRVFGKPNGHHSHNAAYQSDGYCDRKSATKASRGFLKHEKSHEHLSNCEAWHMFTRTTSVDEQISCQRTAQIHAQKMDRAKRFEALSRLIDIKTTLARLRLPFRGHDEKDTSSNRGVFLEIVDLLSRYDATLADHVKKSSENPKGYPSYLSPRSQNKMIHCSATFLRNSIIEKVRKAHYFAVCMDTTPDENRQDQQSVVLRYVQPDGYPKEALVSLCATSSGVGETLYSLLVEVLKKYNLDISNIRGQGYDGCAAMTGQYRGVKSRMLAVNSKAYFVHCYAHRLNLVIVDAVSKNVMSINFFGIVAQLYVFIQGSAKRHSLFQSMQLKIAEEEKDVGEKSNKNIHTLGSLSQTRWSCRVDNCKVLLETLPSIKATLDHT